VLDTNFLKNAMNRVALVACFLLLFVGIGVTISQQMGSQMASQGETKGASTQVVEPTESMKTPKMIVNKTKKYTAVMKTTAGEITLELFADKTPITVNNFISLAKKKFYNNVIFHRVIKGFMIQGGDPTGTGSGGPGYKFADEPFDGEYTRGTLAMANAGPNTNGSQFFIMHKDTPLPKNYVIFGRVIKGIETVDTIAEAETKPDGEGSSPVNPVKILSIDVLESSK